ncbi:MULTISPECIES: hypothetical protein [unclassified Methanoculleus]|uniref:hypothetical protein n=1 Tax=unclassified Methanoculleus TaxID=2619537 RepID=UPI0025D09124|nr:MULTISPECIES: hypothetical protein [unclassified Methanoculleus]MDD2255148.1 hypothetical protein [Methanoculleus sp.]
MLPGLLARDGHARCHRRKEAGRMGIRPGITVLLLLGLVAGAAAAGGTPAIPQELYGGVMIGGSPAPAGTVITATIGGTEYGSVEVVEAGRYGDPDPSKTSRLLVKTTEDRAGETITFYVDGVAAQETVVFTPAVVTVLDLSVAGSSGTGSDTDIDTSGSGGSSTGTRYTPTATAVQTPGQASLATSAAGTVTVRTADGTGAVTIREGTAALDADGNPLGEVTCSKVAAAEVPAAPPGTTVAVALDCGPAGATFDPPAVLTYTLSAEEWAGIGDGATLSVMWYNPASKAWQEIAATVDPATRTITAEVGHFSIYALAWTVPETTAAPEPQQTVSPGEPSWPLAGIGAVLLIGAVIGGLVYLRGKQ